MNFYTYDIETYPNCFLFSGKFYNDPQVYTFEISDRVNQRTELLSHLSFIQNSQVQMVGFNNIGFDYHVVHDLLTNPYTFDALHAHLLGTKIIQSRPFGGSGRGGYYLPMSDRIIPQIDLYKINHFDNPNKATSLKALQFAMRSESVEDLPFAIRPLTSPEMDELRKYNVHDVTETEKFLGKNMPAIVMRQELLEQGVLSGDVLNYSDVKIGTEYLIRKIGRAKCFVSGSKPRQSIRTSVEFKQIILPKIKFRTPEFQAVHDWFSAITLWMGGEARPKLEVDLAGIPFVFGLGGVHASVEQKYFESDDDYVIKDVDVAGMYPAVANVNGFAPEHLGQDFVNAYRQLSVDRKQYARGTSRNLVLKLANNGASGNFENTYSCLYDPKCAYSIRINGQLQLLQLAEVLSFVPGVKLIQANTDGVTALVPRKVEQFFDLWCNDWEAQTGYKLEHAIYKKMWIRDVNNYMSIAVDGSIKRKGAYWYPIKDEDYQGSSGSNWNKDFSNLSAQKGIEAVHIHGYRPEDVVRLMTDPFDFMLRYKTPGGAKLYVGGKEQLKTVRYYVSTKGEPMKKIAMPKGEVGAFKRKNSLSDSEYKRILKEIPEGSWDERIHTKNKSKYAAVTTSVESGRLVRVCNRASDFNWNDVDWSYYVGEIEKLRIGGRSV